MRPLLALLFLQLWSIIQISLTQDACQKPPLVPHARISDDTKKTEYNAGDEINFTCESGYISGPTIRYICTRTGWTALRQGDCYLKPCPLPEETPNGFYQLFQGEDLVFGTTIQYFCNNGYYMVSKEDKRTCVLAGWSNHVPICERSTCELPPTSEGMTVDGLQRNDEYIAPDRFLTFRCTLPGQYLNGEAVLLCGKEGKWNYPFPSCEDIACTIGNMHPNITASELVPANGKIKVGTKLTFKCDEGYTIDRLGEVECLASGQWSASFPTCYDKCIIKGIPNNVNVKYYNQGAQLRPGQKVQFQCRINSHVMQGESEISCLANERWSHPFPTCGAPLGCEGPPSVENAEASSSRANYAHGDKVKYYCPTYYLLEKGDTKTCQNGEWTGDVRCLTPCTVNDEDMKNHNIRLKYRRVNKIYSTHNDHIEFLCTKGRLTGNVGLRVQCNNGVMSLPTCQ